jgi:DnaA family protein
VREAVCCQAFAARILAFGLRARPGPAAPAIDSCGRSPAHCACLPQPTVAEQLIFELSPSEPSTFANFVTGRNGEVVAAVSRAARGEIGETGVVIWGAAGAGKSHLLQASVERARALGRSAIHCGASEAPDSPPAEHALVAVDDLERADAAAQARLFTLFNALAASGGQLVGASAVPPAQLPLREDLRTRLGWGLVFEVLPLTDVEKGAALEALARERGFALPADVVSYLLAHGRRDMASLVATVAALDRHSLAAKRPVTLPLLREWLQREIGLRD